MLTESMIADRLRLSSYEFRTLEKSHRRLDLELIDLQKRHGLTLVEAQLKKQLQKKKLATKDQMTELIRACRNQELQAAIH